MQIFRLLFENILRGNSNSKCLETKNVKYVPYYQQHTTNEICCYFLWSIEFFVVPLHQNLERRTNVAEELDHSGTNSILKRMLLYSPFIPVVTAIGAERRWNEWIFLSKAEPPSIGQTLMKPRLVAS